MYLAVYDVTDDGERERVAGVLEGYGLRVQKSVFECRLTRSAKERMVSELEKLELKSGFLFLYQLGPAVRRQGVGSCPGEPFSESHYAYIVS